MFETLILRTQAIQEYATNRLCPNFKHEIVDTIYTVVFQTGLFFENCNDWDDKAEGHKIWETLKAHFIEIKRRYKLCQRATKNGRFPWRECNPTCHQQPTQRH